MYEGFLVGIYQQKPNIQEFAIHHENGQKGIGLLVLLSCWLRPWAYKVFPKDKQSAPELFANTPGAQPPSAHRHRPPPGSQTRASCRVPLDCAICQSTSEACGVVSLSRTRRHTMLGLSGTTIQILAEHAIRSNARRCWTLVDSQHQRLATRPSEILASHVTLILAKAHRFPYS